MYNITLPGNELQKKQIDPYQPSDEESVSMPSEIKALLAINLVMDLKTFALSKEFTARKGATTLALNLTQKKDEGKEKILQQNEHQYK